LDQVPTSVLALGRKIGKEMFDIDPTDKELTEQANRQLAMRAHRMTQKEFDEQQEALQQAAEQSQAAADTAPTMSESEAEQMQADDDAIAVGGGLGFVGEEGEPEGSDADDDGIGTASGGQIKGYQEGDLVEEQADTTMDTAGLGPMGLVDDMAGDQVTGVEDDLDMEVDDGAYVLNADAVELIGLKDLNELTKDAIDIAIESDIPLPKKIDPTKRVPIKISNGEFVIPAILVPIIGLENLEKMNKRGLEYREKNREEEPPQEAQEAQEAQAVPQENIPVEPSEIPSGGVPGEINLAKGGAIADQMDQLLKV